MCESIEVYDKHAVLSMSPEDKQFLAIKLFIENKYKYPSRAYDEITKYMNWDEIHEFWWSPDGASRCIRSFESKLKEVNDLELNLDIILEKYAIRMRYLRQKRRRSDSVSE